MENPTETLAITVPQMAKLVGLSRGAAYEAIRRGTLPALRVGRRLLVPLGALQRLLDGGKPL